MGERPMNPTLMNARIVRISLVALVAPVLHACAQVDLLDTIPPDNSAAPEIFITGTPDSTATASPSLTAVITAAPTATATPTITATPDPYEPYTVAGLARRMYGGGELEVYQRWQANAAFERAYFQYPSDGLRVHGFMNIPSSPGEHPVVVVLHGYIDPSVYTMQTYTTRYADALARAGYFVLHPNYRSYPPSDVGPNPFRAGYAIDVLNLLEIVRAQAGLPGPLEAADAERIGLLGHSMGGGIAIRTMVVDQDIDAVVLYGSMSADEERNFARILEWSGGRAGWEELNAPSEALERISPIHHLLRVESAVSIHHGQEDLVVPPDWSDELCQLLSALGKQVECFSYPEQAHTFMESGEDLFLERVLDFFEREFGSS